METSLADACRQEKNQGDGLISLNIKDIQQITERVYRIKHIYSSIIDKLGIPQPPQGSSEVGPDKLEAPKGLVQVAIMLKNVDDLLSSSIHDLSYVEDNI